MKSKILEVLIILHHFPRSQYIFSIGLLFALILQIFGANAVSEFQLSGPMAQIQETIRQVTADNYMKGIIVVLITTVTATFRQFTRDKKKFDRLY